MEAESLLEFMENDREELAENRLFQALTAAGAEDADYRFFAILAAKRAMAPLYLRPRFKRGCLRLLRIARRCAMGAGSDALRNRALKRAWSAHNQLGPGYMLERRVLRTIIASLRDPERARFAPLKNAMHELPDVKFAPVPGSPDSACEQVSGYLLQFLRRVLQRELLLRKREARPYQVEICLTAQVSAKNEESALAWGDGVVAKVREGLAASGSRDVRLNEIGGVALATAGRGD